MRTALLLLISTVALADSSADVLNVFSAAAEALANDDSSAFLDNFDRNMLRGTCNSANRARRAASMLSCRSDAIVAVPT